MSHSALVRWVLPALVGLAIAIAVAIAAADLAGQQIGIASESVSAGDALAPSLQQPAGEGPGRGGRDHGGAEEPTTATTPAEPPTTAAPAEEAGPPPDAPVEPLGEGGDDHGGHGSDGDD